MPEQTLEKAINNEQLRGFPCMNVKDIRRYLAPSPATAKGRMKKPKAGIRSTCNKKSENVNEEAEYTEDMHPTDGNTTSEGVVENKNNMFCFAAIADKEKGTVYTDATGALPVMSLNGKQYYMVLYDYDNNYINAIPVSDLKDETIVATVKDFFEEMEEHGHQPRLNISDNQAAASLKKYLKTKECKWQFVEPHNHRVNAAERAIQTWKNHFLSGLASLPAEFPIAHWCQLIR